MVCVLALTLAMSVCAFAADTVTEDEVFLMKKSKTILHRMMHLPRRPWSPGKV